MSLENKMQSLQDEINSENFVKVPLNIQKKKKEQLEYLKKELDLKINKKNKQLILVKIELKEDKYLFFLASDYSQNDNFLIYLITHKCWQFSSLVKGYYELYLENEFLNFPKTYSWEILEKWYNSEKYKNIKEEDFLKYYIQNHLEGTFYLTNEKLEKPFFILKENKK